VTPVGHTSLAGPALDALKRSPLGPVPRGASATSEWLWRELALVWADFERRLEAIPVVRGIYDGTITVEQYRELLLNLRQEVVEGGHWIARAASSMSIDLLPVHRVGEHGAFRPRPDGLKQFVDRARRWGVMPITSSGRVVSELSHAAWAWARQRISPSRRP
jgi:hypothetical protein